MTPHRWTTMLLLAVLSLLLALDLAYEVPWWSYLLPLLVYLGITVIGSTYIDSGHHMEVHCHGARDRKQVGLSFDDGPHPEITPQVLDILQKRGVKAAFFLIGERVEAHPELVERIHREGHLIGNHSWGHGFFFDLLPVKRMTRELTRTSELIASITGVYPTAFRPPYGVTNPMLRKAVERSDAIPVGWDVRSFDTSKSEEASVERVLERVRPGSIILLHDTHQKVLGVLPRLLDGLQEEGHACVRIDQLLQKDFQDEVSAA